MKREEIAKNLQRSLIFSSTTEREINNFAEMARVEIFAEGQYVYHKGDPSEIFYVIAMGEAELTLDQSDGTSRIVGRIGPGGHFGETGILTGKPRSLSVRALCDLVIICFDKRFFRTSFLSNSRIHAQLDSALAERLRLAFQDQVNIDEGIGNKDPGSTADDVITFEDSNISAIALRKLARQRQHDIRESQTAKKTRKIIEDFASNSEPYLLTGEAGTGKSIIAKQIHTVSGRRHGEYREIDLREFEPLRLERNLFGLERSTFPFAQARQAGLFEQTNSGTLVFTHIHLLKEEMQAKLVRIITSSTYSHVDSDRQLAMQSRIVFISTFSLDHLQATNKLIPELLEMLMKQHFDVAPVRQHKQDIPRLVSHYLDRFSREYGKKIQKVSPETLGIFMNYDWPGNLTELSNVVRRAVMLADHNEILPDQILLGLPKTEGKWEYNLLRSGWIRKLLESRVYPLLPQIVVGCLLVFTIIFLFSGAEDPEKNIGMTIGWYIGWPLMIFSFFFLARTWCSVCTLAVPGTVLQNIVKPTRNTPDLIKNYSGWIMAVLCILVFWVEVVWDAYRNPYLTGGIILIITLGSLIFSVLFSRRSWCRYLCPLGAVNAIFSMPSIVELRSNRHVCLNRCQNHSCFRGEAETPGCPMFRHPYLVDNNRDCIMCSQCIKSCGNSSIQLNVRLAPQELWALETPRLADSFLIVSLMAIYFPFALHAQFIQAGQWTVDGLAMLGFRLPYHLASSVLFFLNIIIFQAGYYLMVNLQAWYAKMDRRLLLSLFGYGFIPLVLGGFMAQHLELFVDGAGRIVPNIVDLVGFSGNYDNVRLISEDSTYVLRFLTVVGGLLASLYATAKVIQRALAGEQLTKRKILIPYSFLVCLGGLLLYLL